MLHGSLRQEGCSVRGEREWSIWPKGVQSSSNCLPATTPALGLLSTPPLPRIQREVVVRLAFGEGRRGGFPSFSCLGLSHSQNPGCVLNEAAPLQLQEQDGAVVRRAATHEKGSLPGVQSRPSTQRINMCTSMKAVPCPPHVFSLA